MSNKTHVIVDLDGTLCDHSHRKHLLGGDFNEYHAALVDDALHEDIAQLVEDLSIAHYVIVACTGRPERYRERTLAHLREKEVQQHIDLLLMRPDDDFRSDADVKLALIDEAFDDRATALEQIAFILDDRDKVVEAFRNAGFRVLQVANGDY